MIKKQKTSRTLNVMLWIAQSILAILLLSGAAMKFMPVEKISVMMPWTGQVPVFLLRLLAMIDLLGALGLLLPGLLHIKPVLVIWACAGISILMLSAIVFHICRGEANVIGFNIICLLMAVFITIGRIKRQEI
ncbi:MAG: DoxX family protein [Bacteroidia bacterium]|nr:DoxX family protein [Bacteroidia bacterium]